jgi:tetratricopeptide (TPR) repeat protein
MAAEHPAGSSPRSIDVGSAPRSPASEPPLAAARAAYERCAWREARDLLRVAQQSEPLDPHDLERLAAAEWWVGDMDGAIDARERAYQGYLSGGDERSAARNALKLAQHYAAKLSHTAAKGWRRRTQRLLERLPDCPEHGHAILNDLWDIFDASAPEEGVAAVERAVELGARFGDRDLEVMALAELGRVYIHTGRIREGMELEEEACAAALGGEIGPYATAVTFCSAISTSKELTDFPRAGELSAAAKHWCERQAIEGFPGVCRVYRAEVMRLRGEWLPAEEEARRACDELRTFSPMVAAVAFRELGEIRLRTGDLAGAEEAFKQAQALDYNAQPGHARLQLLQGKPRAALVGLLAGMVFLALAMTIFAVGPVLAPPGATYCNFGARGAPEVGGDGQSQSAGGQERNLSPLGKASAVKKTRTAAAKTGAKAGTAKKSDVAKKA